MEFMKNIIFTSCILTVAITIAGSLKNGEKFKHQLNVIFSIIFSASILSSIVKTGMDLDIPELKSFDYSSEYKDFKKNTDIIIKSEIESRINSVIEELMKKNNISYKKIKVNIDIYEDKSININSIYYEGDDFKRAEKIIKENLKGVEVNLSG